jgi:hypothetical protein
MKGCYVYFCNTALRDHFCLGAFPCPIPNTFSGHRPERYHEERNPRPRIEAEVNEGAKFVEFLPLYSLKAACGAFGEGQYAEETGWVKVEGLGA